MGVHDGHRSRMKERFRGDAQEFIEDIPYEETRGYVRLVMRNLIFYSLLKPYTHLFAKQFLRRFIHYFFKKNTCLILMSKIIADIPEFTIL